MRRWLLPSCVLAFVGCAEPQRSATITIESKGDGLTVATACFAQDDDFFCSIVNDQAVVARGEEVKLLEPSPGLQFLSETLEAQFEGDAVEGELFEANWSTTVEGSRQASVVMPALLTLVQPTVGQAVSSKDLEIRWEGGIGSGDEIEINLNPSCGNGDFDLEARDVKDTGSFVLPRRFFKDVQIPPQGCDMEISVSRIKNAEIQGGTREDALRAIQTSPATFVTLLP